MTACAARPPDRHRPPAPLTPSRPPALTPSRPPALPPSRPPALPPIPSRVPPLLKRLELRWRRALLAAGRRPFSGRATATPLDIVQVPPHARMLVIRLERIGDVLVGVPVLRALRAWYPDARIELLVSRPNRAVAGAVGRFVDHVWIYEKTVRSAVGLLRALRRARYDVIVDLVDHPSTNAQLTIRWCRPRAAVGLLHAESGLYTHAAPTLDPAVVHPVERFAQLLLPFGIDPATEPLDLEYPLARADIARARATLGQSTRPYRLGVNLSGRQRERHWGAQNYVALIRDLAERHPRFEIWVCGAPQDAAEVARIAAEGRRARGPGAGIAQRVRCHPAAVRPAGDAGYGRGPHRGGLQAPLGRALPPRAGRGALDSLPYPAPRGRRCAGHPFHPGHRGCRSGGRR